MLRTVSTYVTVGHALDPKLVALARKRGVRLIISWLPDKGTDSVKAPGFRLSAIAAGKFDKDLKALALQIKALPHGATVRIYLPLRRKGRKGSKFCAVSGLVAPATSLKVRRLSPRSS